MASWNWAIIGYVNGLPIRCLNIIWTDDSLWAIKPYGTNFSEIEIKIQKLSHTRKCIWKCPTLSSISCLPFCSGIWVLTHFPLVPHTCVRAGSALVQVINDLAPVRCQTITWTNADLLSIGPLETNFSYINIQNVSSMKMHLKMSSAKWWPFCSGEIS